MPSTAPGKASCKGMDLERGRIKKRKRNCKTFQSPVENGGADSSDSSDFSQTSYSEQPLFQLLQLGVIQLSG